MRIANLEITNYRSIKNLRLDCNPVVSLIGPNNHGKSNILYALEFGLTTSSKPSPDDFFVDRDPNSNDLWVEMTFSELTDQEKTTFKRHVLADGTVRIRKTARLQGDAVENAYNGWVEQPEEACLRAENSGDYTSRDKINETPLKDFVPASGRITKAQVEEAQQSYIKDHRQSLKFVRALENSPLLGQKNVAGGVLPEFFLIPAVRDLTDEIKLKATTTFGRLMNRAVKEMAERDPRFSEARNQLETVIAALNQRDSSSGTVNELAVLEKGIESELKSWGVRVNIEVTPPELEKLFELGTSVHLDDGVRTTADRKGHGLQRAMMFALLRSWAAVLRAERTASDGEEISPRKQSDSIVFAMEEPELFLHPHAQRRLSVTLREIADTPQHQVFLCTHSTQFVDLSHYKEVAIISKESPKVGSHVRQCNTELFSGDDVDDRKKRFHMAKWINPDRGEMFFAKRVVFVEGETEKVMLPFTAQILNVFDSDVSIIDCGSKYNLPLYINVAKAFKIPYVAVHDEDPLPDPIPAEWDSNKRTAKERTFKLNEEISRAVEAPLGKAIMFKPDFEMACGVSRSKGEKMGKALAALEYFEGVDVDKIPAPLKEVVEACFSAAK